MGNRGNLQRAGQQWEEKRWITCTLTFPGIERVPVKACKYTKLLFLDEATAFAAGHRPSAQCRRDKFKEFRSAVDKIIHVDRTVKGEEKVTYEAPVGELPHGTFVEVDEIAFLVWRGELPQWSFDGYGPARDALPLSTIVRVLTPKSNVLAFKTGFTPCVHPSATA